MNKTEFLQELESYSKSVIQNIKKELDNRKGYTEKTGKALAGELDYDGYIGYMNMLMPSIDKVIKASKEIRNSIENYNKSSVEKIDEDCLEDSVGFILMTARLIEQNGFAVFTF